MLEIPYDEPRNLNAYVDDLAALTALSAVWHGHTPIEIADSLANALLTIGDLAFVYVRVTGLPDQDALEIAHAHPRLSVTLQAPALGRILAPWLTFNGSTPPPSLPSPVGGGSLRIAVTPIGLEGTHGVVVAGAPQPAFPTKLDRLLLNGAVNQAAVALQAAQLVAALHETAELKDRLFAQERMACAEAEATVQRNAQFYREMQVQRECFAITLASIGKERTRELADTNATLQAEVVERKHAEAEMRNFASLVENSIDFIGIAALNGQVLFVNAAGQTLVGLTGEPAVQTTTMLDYVAEQDRKHFQQDVLPLVFRDGHWEGETLFRHFKTGALIPMWQHIFFLTEQDSQQRLALATISRNITERKQAEQARQHVLSQLIHAQEDERRRIAHDLHDSLGQYIIALDLGLRSIQARDSCPAPVETSIQELRELALRLDGEIERLTFELRPSALDDLGLKDAMRQHVRQWSVSSGIAVDFHTRGLNDKRLVDAVETTLYRIIQEALTNVRKHAAATRVSLIVERRRDEVLAIIEDNGSGFDLEAVQRTPRRFGLQSMTERAALAGGRLDLETAPGAGTTIYVHIPLDPAQR